VGWTIEWTREPEKGGQHLLRVKSCLKCAREGSGLGWVGWEFSVYNRGLGGKMAGDDETEKVSRTRVGGREKIGGSRPAAHSKQKRGKRRKGGLFLLGGIN